MNVTYYHGSNALYEWPSFKAVDNWQMDDDRASKVMLGYYVTTDEEFANSIGTYTYTVRMKANVRVFKLSIDDMLKLYRSFIALDTEDIVPAYIQYRNTMAQDYDVIDVVEYNGRVGESIIVNLDAIEEFFLYNVHLKET